MLVVTFFFFSIHRLNFFESLKFGDQLNNKNVLFAKQNSPLPSHNAKHQMGICLAAKESVVVILLSL